MAILVGPTQNLSILPRQKWRKIKMAAISPNFEVRAQKLVYNPKLYMLLGVCGKYQKTLFLKPKTSEDKSWFVLGCVFHTVVSILV